MEQPAVIEQKNPTFQQSGITRIFCINRSNGTLGINYFPPGLTYSPPSTPPWTEGKQWVDLRSGKTAKLAPFPTGGALPVLELSDRSNQSVIENDTYLFHYTFSSCRIYLELHGVDGGSVIKPGIGLYNLKDAPQAWTYITPQIFEGSWEIQWINPYYVTPISMTIAYVPQRYHVFDPHNFSVLTYTFSAVGPGIPMEEVREVPESDEDSENGIVETSSPYDLVDQG